MNILVSVIMLVDVPLWQLMFKHMCKVFLYSVGYTFWWWPVVAKACKGKLLYSPVRPVTLIPVLRNVMAQDVSHKDMNTPISIQFIVFCNSSGSCHLDDLMYLFPQDHFFPGSRRTPEDDQMVDTLITLWTNFAHTGYVTYSSVFHIHQTHKHILMDWMSIDLIKIKFANTNI
jgi:hypothetical protein